MRQPHRSLNVVEVNSIEAIDSTQWDELWEHCPDATVFQSRQWLQAWLDVFGSPEDPPKLLAAFDASRLVGLAPLVRDPAAGCWKIVADDYSDYQTFLAWEGSPQILQALLAAADKCVPVGESILLNDIPQFSALALLLASAPSASTF